MWAVFKKELKSYFLSPIGYIVIAVFMLIYSIFFYLTTISYGQLSHMVQFSWEICIMPQQDMAYYLWFHY